MTHITLNSGQVRQLAAGAPLVKCRDDAGQLVGFLHLAGRNDDLRLPDVSIEQLAAYEQEPGGRSLSEILADLRTRR
jgi:hypothetical protein